MLFNSYFFIFVFLPLTLYGFFKLGTITSNKACLIWLVLTSFVFYGWFNPYFLFIIVFSIVVNAAIAKQLIKNQQKRLLIAGIVLNLGLIGIFKYAQFATDNICWLFDLSAPDLKIALPLAISFFTFQQIAFIVDCYHGKVKKSDFLSYCLFIVFFPQLIAGPIVQHHQVISQFENKRINKINMQNIALGLSIFVVGLFKKVLFADNCASFANPIFLAAEQGIALTFFESWWGAIAYTLQLYFDFSGYSDMAIGLALLFNVKLPINFNSPYKAINIIDFWRRWHITLSTFLRDYLYIPLGGNRKGVFQRHLNLLITMLLGGFWHGASWNFVIWGALHGSYLVINHSWRTFRQSYLEHDLNQSTWIGKTLSRLLTIFCVIIAWVFFRAGTLDAALNMLKTMMGLNGISLIQSLGVKFEKITPWLMQHGITFNGLFTNELTDLKSATFLMIPLWMIILFLPNSQQCILSQSRYSSFWQNNLSTKGGVAILQKNTLSAILIGIMGMLSIICLAKASDFIYYQF